MGLLQVIWPSKVRDFQRGEMCVTKRYENMQSALSKWTLCLVNTVKPLLSGHLSWDLPKCPLNRGCLLNRGL